MALNKPNWVDAMHKELNQFEKLGVWKLVELPKGKKSLDTRWILVQIYVGDIIFGSTSSKLCKEFESVMKKTFEMSSLGEMTMFLGLQEDSTGILIHQAKYVEDMLEKFGFGDAKPALAPMAERPLLTPDIEGEFVDQTDYRSMIRLLMYLTASRPDIMFVVCQCA
ncbi:uncharacterized mitochondrial protein AtMg00810-like [Lactuca sativa]|uniref:uncharacterized mitochondrial protein AtMg00810-like n=1 Tax=Lactuca sativa TaxID=4236 RepID=UPI0022AF9681|nr:uncharacterized mitochondrial protein AtMg00810-like [Lactuca sativa]